MTGDPSSLSELPRGTQRTEVIEFGSGNAAFDELRRDKVGKI